jgi:RNA polymerase sigma-70 factor (ECF subfamily)
MWTRRSEGEGSERERELLRRAKAGDAAEFGELVHRYQDRIYTLIAARTRQPEDALELTQEVFLKAYRHLESFRGDCSVATWLYRIAVNTCTDFARHCAATPEIVSLDGEELIASGFEPEETRAEFDPERAIMNRELGRLLRRWIRDLPEHQRLPVVLRDIQGLSMEEAALVLSCPVGTVKSRLRRGRYVLQQRLRHYMNGGPEPARREFGPMQRQLA